ncbi:MAG: hypothetical protein RLZZ396_1848 [Planctomycetota bacterium]|jgi:hypothetical protein
MSYPNHWFLVIVKVTERFPLNKNSDALSLLKGQVRARDNFPFFD